MAKRTRKTDETVIDKRIKEGRGQGRGKDYIPWLLVQDVPSIGLATRVKGCKTGRIHHLFSKLEFAKFLISDWASRVIDIREQYPLLPITETLALAKVCGIRHPAVPGTRQPIVLTTDFVLTTFNGLERVELARTVKYSNDLLSQRTLEKLELERRYWSARNISWSIVTEHDIPHVLAKNVELLHNHRDITSRLPLTQDDLHDIAVVLTSAVRENTASLRHVAITCDKRLGLELGTSLTIAYHLLATKQWTIDMNTLFQPGKPLLLLATNLETPKRKEEV